MPESAGVAEHLPDRLTARHRRFVIVETLIGMTMSALIPGILIWLLRTPRAIPLFGDDSLASSLVAVTLPPALTLPIILTLVVRRRVRQGTAPALGWPLRMPRFIRALPASLPLRGLAGAAVALLVLPATGLSLMNALDIDPVGATAFLVYNALNGMALAALILPATLILALADGARAGCK